MNSKIAFVFPGQGSQYSGMGRDLCEKFPVAREVFEEANDALGFSISDLCFTGSAEDLQLTENTQPAILTVSVAAFRVLQQQGAPQPALVAGHSLGEYSALVSAGALNFSDAVKAVRLRGRYMQEAVPVGLGAMAAILGSNVAAVEEICREAAEGQVCSAANINSTSQVVIAGDSAAVDRAVELAKARGAKRAIKLQVSAPFHCALMMPAQERLSADLGNIEFHDLGIPLITNVDAAVISRGAAARDSLVRQVSSPVRWLQTIEEMLANGITQFIEIGPGKVLCGLIRQINRDARCANVEDSQSLGAALQALS
jgi:[acyl-carrier-protein] S-malonyltransferase